MVSDFHHDALFTEAAPDAILVLVNTSTRSGSSNLVNSPNTGAWDQFVASRVVPEIDARFRTIATRDGRATAGLSSGGFSALSFGLRHPELFAVVTASAPSGPDVTKWLFGYPGGPVPARSMAMLRVETASGGAGFFASYGNDWSPDDSPLGFASPLDLATGQPVPEVVERWRAQGPSVWLTNPGRAAALRTAFDGRLCLSVGKRDELGLYPVARELDEQLTRMGFRHELHVAAGGHLNPAVMSSAYRCAAARLASPAP